MNDREKMDMTYAIIAGNARFLANEFANGSIKTDSETIKRAFTEIAQLSIKNDEAFRRMTRALMA